MAVIEVEHLVKQFQSVKKEKGLKGSVKALFKPERRTITAVKDISFSIEPGEIVGYIGPNGAGKSTTVKMMSGILTPTSGEVRINGISPVKDRKRVVQQLGVVFGQRTQLYWDLRLGESFELLRRVYDVDDRTFRENMDMMNEILDIDSIIDTPVRQLSLRFRHIPTSDRNPELRPGQLPSQNRIAQSPAPASGPMNPIRVSAPAEPSAHSRSYPSAREPPKHSRSPMPTRPYRSIRVRY